MKIRSGFISNSSSTSYLIAVPAEASEEDTLFIDLFKEIMDKWSEDTQEMTSKRLSPREYIESLNNRVKELQKDKDFLQKEAAELTALSNKEEARKAVSTYIDIVTKRELTTTRNRRSDIYIGLDDSLKTDIERVTQEIETVNRRIEAAQEELSIIKENATAKEIIGFEIDNWFSDAEKRMIIIIEKGPLKLIKKKHS
jgi:hypothetical protein